MDGTNFMDEMECGNFFDHIDDLLDFPTDDLDTDLLGVSGDCGSFPITFPGSSSDALLSSDSVFSGSIAPDLSDQLSVPYEDIVQLEWLSNFVEDSFSGGGMTMEKQSNISSQSHHQFQTSSPVSVLESSSSSSTGKSLPASHEKRARSKRPRPPTFTTNPNSIFIPCFPPVLGTVSTEPEPPKKTLNEPPKKKKKKKIKIVPPSKPNPADPNPATLALRKCMHCEITKTPQWRAGPMGPKTLCNACGVRYKSGRLFPEYRPAASPTFIPSVHSNSHKKVIEMRTTKTCEENVAMPPPTTLGELEQCNNSI